MLGATLDVAQAHLAEIAGLDPISQSLSLAWRRRLDAHPNLPVPVTDSETRRQTAYNILIDRNRPHTEAFHKLIHNHSAMIVLTELSSSIRRVKNVSIK
jgi:hypothetical protein